MLSSKLPEPTLLEFSTPFQIRYWRKDESLSSYIDCIRSWALGCVLPETLQPGHVLHYGVRPYHGSVEKKCRKFRDEDGKEKGRDSRYFNHPKDSNFKCDENPDLELAIRAHSPQERLELLLKNSDKEEHSCDQARRRKAVLHFARENLTISRGLDKWKTILDLHLEDNDTESPIAERDLAMSLYDGMKFSPLEKQLITMGFNVDRAGSDKNRQEDLVVAIRKYLIPGGEVRVEYSGNEGQKKNNRTSVTSTDRDGDVRMEQVAFSKGKQNQSPGQGKPKQFGKNSSKFNNSNGWSQQQYYPGKNNNYSTSWYPGQQTKGKEKGLGKKGKGKKGKGKDGKSQSKGKGVKAVYLATGEEVYVSAENIMTENSQSSSSTTYNDWGNFANSSDWTGNDWSGWSEWSGDWNM